MYMQENVMSVSLISHVPYIYNFTCPSYVGCLFLFSHTKFVIILIFQVND